MWYILGEFPAVMSLLDLMEEMTSTLSFLRLPGTENLSPGLEITENIDGSVYVEKNMASGWIVTTSEKRFRHVVEERVLAPAGCPTWRRPE